MIGHLIALRPDGCGSKPMFFFGWKQDFSVNLAGCTEGTASLEDCGFAFRHP
jgi:hypothetical protein